MPTEAGTHDTFQMLDAAAHRVRAASIIGIGLAVDPGLRRDFAL
jgi:hypothetical protein